MSKFNQEQYEAANADAAKERQKIVLQLDKNEQEKVAALEKATKTLTEAGLPVVIFALIKRDGKYQAMADTNHYRIINPNNEDYSPQMGDLTTEFSTVLFWGIFDYLSATSVWIGIKKLFPSMPWEAMYEYVLDKAKRYYRQDDDKEIQA